MGILRWVNRGKGCLKYINNTKNIRVIICLNTKEEADKIITQTGKGKAYNGSYKRLLKQRTKYINYINYPELLFNK